MGADLRELLREVVENGCHEDSEWNGPVCWYCGGEYHERFHIPSYYEHTKDCLFVRMEQAMEMDPKNIENHNV